MNLEKLKSELRQFVNEREWDQFHNPKNLSMALAGEAGELLEIFQWLSAEESKLENLKPETLQSLKEELADLQIYLIRLADKLKINLEQACFEKIEINRKKYPIEKAKGKSTKYNSL